MPNLGFGGFLLLCWWCLIVPLLILLLIDSNFQPATIQVFCQTSQKKKTFWAIISKLWYSSETVGWKWTMWTVLSQFCWESNYRNRISTEISTRNSSTETGLWWRWLPTKFASKVPKPRAAATPRGHLGTVISCTLVAIWVAIPIGSMYAIYGNIYHQYTPNVSIYIPYMDPMGYDMISLW